MLISFVLSSKYYGLKRKKESLLRSSDSYFSYLWWLFVQRSLFRHEQMQYKKQVISSSIAEICTKTFWMRTLFNEMANIWICLKKLNQKSRNLMPWRDDIMLSEINTLMKWITKSRTKSSAREILMQFSPNARQSIMYVGVFCN